MPRETGGDGGGDVVSKGERARRMYETSLKRYNDLGSTADFFESEAVGEAFDGCMRLLEGENALLLQDFFYDLPAGAEEKARREMRLLPLIFDLEKAVRRVQEEAKRVGEMTGKNPEDSPVFLDRIKVLNTIIEAIKILHSKP